jgi:hypothetical protein
MWADSEKGFLVNEILPSADKMEAAAYTRPLLTST